MIADYYVWRRRLLHLAALYQPNSEYRFTHGFSLIAIFSLAVAVLPNIPGFLVTIKTLNAGAIPPFLVHLYDYAWFVGFAIAFAVYLFLRYTFDKTRSALPLFKSPDMSERQPMIS
jgi:NCS1 family nucleobase:cation symporter-1